MTNEEINQKFDPKMAERYYEEYISYDEKAKRCFAISENPSKYLSVDDKLNAQKSIKIFQCLSRTAYYNYKSCEYHSCEHLWTRVKDIKEQTRNYCCIKCHLKPFGSYRSSEPSDQEVSDSFASKYYIKQLGLSSAKEISEFIAGYKLVSDRKIPEDTVTRIMKVIKNGERVLTDEEIANEFAEKANGDEFYMPQPQRAKRYF